LAILERARKKQCARVNSVKEGDANTKFFHLRVNARRRKNHLHRLKHNNGWVTEHIHKEKIIHDHFSSAMGKATSRNHDLNWENFHFGGVDLEGILSPKRKCKRQLDKCLPTRPPGRMASPVLSSKSVGASSKTTS
jgi:hypothetical protein